MPSTTVLFTIRGRCRKKVLDRCPDLDPINAVKWKDCVFEDDTKKQTNPVQFGDVTQVSASTRRFFLVLLNAPAAEAVSAEVPVTEVPWNHRQVEETQRKNKQKNQQQQETETHRLHWKSFVFFTLLFSDLIVSEVCEINLTFTSPLTVCSFTGYIIRSGFIFARGHFLLLDPDRFLLYCLWKNKKFCRGHRRRRVMTGLKLEPDVKSVNLNHRRVFFFKSFVFWKYFIFRFLSSSH